MSLYQTLHTYLEEHGWYFDVEHFCEIWEREPTSFEDFYRSPCWTLPQWDEYWRKPFSDKPGHPNYDKPKTRRYESFAEAVNSQLLREEQPAVYGAFFGDNVAQESPVRGAES